MSLKTMIKREYRLEQLFSNVEEPISVVIIGHQYLTMLISYTNAMAENDIYNVPRKMFEEFEWKSFPKKISILKKHGDISEDTIKKLENINTERIDIAHRLFYENSHEIAVKYLNPHFVEDFKKRALECESELFPEYVKVYEEKQKLKLGVE